MAADLVVGIDFGMSGMCFSLPPKHFLYSMALLRRVSIGTGVAYCQKYGKVKTLLWGTENAEEKAPTKLLYDVQNPLGEPLGWGYDVPGVYSDSVHIEEWFKINLGKEGIDQPHVERHVKDYLSCLYHSLSRRFTVDLLGGKQWADATIRFLFSAPATWTTGVVQGFQKIASDAGFGTCDGHTIVVSLTEPQAVAAYHLCRDKDETDDTLQVHNPAPYC